MHVPDKLRPGQAWDDDLRGAQRVIIRIDGVRVYYKVEFRRGGVTAWASCICRVESFWTWVRRNRAHVR